MSQGAISTKKLISIIVVTWVLSLATTLAIVYVWPIIFPINSNQIADEAIITAKLADGAVTSAKILDGTITAVDMADGSIIAVKVADGAVTTAKIADGAVTADKVADGAIVTVKLADGSVTSAKILDGTIIAADLATGAVTSMKIADGAVTTAKIADGAVTNDKLAAGAIPHNITYAVGDVSTSSTSFEDMPDMAVEITLTRNSTLIIICSAQTWFEGTGIYAMYWRAMVNTTRAQPDSSWIIITGSPDYSSHSYTFVYPNVTAGTYTVKIQWRVYQASTIGYVDERTLTVIALPS